MSKKEQYEQQTENLLEPIVTGFGFELVDVEYVKEAGTWYLRAYIDNCLLYTSPSPRDGLLSRMPSSA